MQRIDAAVKKAREAHFSTEAKAPPTATATADFQGFLPLEPLMPVLVWAHVIGGVLATELYLIAPLRIAQWLLIVITIGDISLLAFWAGMGSRHSDQGYVIAWFGSSWLAAVWGLPLAPAGAPNPLVGVLLAAVIGALAAFAVVTFTVTTLGVLWALVRRKIAHMQSFASADAGHRLQWSLKQLLATTLAAGVLLALARYATRNPMAVEAAVVRLLMSLLCLGFNSVVPAWAALSRGNVRWRIILTMAAALVLSLALAVTWEMVTWDVIATALGGLTTAALTIASLLVVRWCGYRLVGNT